MQKLAPTLTEDHSLRGMQVKVQARNPSVPSCS
jgi:hypothetical protein